jgi:hypothetical protein
MLHINPPIVAENRPLLPHVEGSHHTLFYCWTRKYSITSLRASASFGGLSAASSAALSSCVLVGGSLHTLPGEHRVLTRSSTTASSGACLTAANPLRRACAAAASHAAACLTAGTTLPVHARRRPHLRPRARVPSRDLPCGRMLDGGKLPSQSKPGGGLNCGRVLRCPVAATPADVCSRA